MINRILLCFGYCCYSFCGELCEYNALTIKEIIENIASIQTNVYILADNDLIILYKREEQIRGVSRISSDPSRGFHISMPENLIISEISDKSYFDFLETECSYNQNGDLATKEVANIFKVSYLYDQESRLIKCVGENNEFIFINKDEYIRINSSDEDIGSRLFRRTKNILGTLDNFIIKDDSGVTILAVINDTPYFSVVDLEGSLRKILDVTGKEIASVEFSKSGHVISLSGETFIPYCFRGMYQDKFSEIYFDKNHYYDADVGDYLVVPD